MEGRGRWELRKRGSFWFFDKAVERDFYSFPGSNTRDLPTATAVQSHFFLTLSRSRSLSLSLSHSRFLAHSLSLTMEMIILCVRSLSLTILCRSSVQTATLWPISSQGHFTRSRQVNLRFASFRVQFPFLSAYSIAYFFAMNSDVCIVGVTVRRKSH